MSLRHIKTNVTCKQDSRHLLHPMLETGSRGPTWKMQNLGKVAFPNPHLPHLFSLPDQSSPSFYSSLTGSDAFSTEMTCRLVSHTRHGAKLPLGNTCHFWALVFQGIFTHGLRLESLSGWSASFESSPGHPWTARAWTVRVHLHVHLFSHPRPALCTHVFHLCGFDPLQMENSIFRFPTADRKHWFQLEVGWILGCDAVTRIKSLTWIFHCEGGEMWLCFGRFCTA